MTEAIHPLRHPSSARVSKPVRWVCFVEDIYQITGRGLSASCLMPRGAMKEKYDKTGKLIESEIGTKVLIYHAKTMTFTLDEIVSIERYSISWWRFAPANSIGILLKNTKKGEIEVGDVIIEEAEE